MDLRFFASVLLLAMVACETVPDTMDTLVFDAEMSRLNDNPSIASVDSQLETLLARSDLTQVQRGEALYLRANKRLDKRFNLPGAIADFEAFIQLSPEDTRVATANRRIVFAQSEIGSAQARLAQLQNLPDWFDDKVLMGDLDAATSRYRTAGITPNEAQLYLMREARFVCSADENADAETLHKYGPLREDVEGAVWCDDPSLS